MIKRKYQLFRMLISNYRSYSGSISKGRSFFIRNYKPVGINFVIRSSSQLKTYSYA